MKNTLYFLLLMLSLSSCKPKENMVYMDQDRAVVQQQVQQAVFEGSRLQSGDLLDIKVTAFDEYAVRPFNLHSMNQVSVPNEVSQGQVAQTAPQGYVIDNEGYLMFPVLGKIMVKGMTMAELRNDLEQRLTRYLSDPLVTIRQLNFNITVLGEVKNPGQYTSSTDKVTILQALGMAGDMTDYGDRTKVKLIRHADGLDETYIIDFTDRNITTSPYYYMQQNDVLYVEPDVIKRKSANVDPNRNLAFQIGGVVLGLASILITLLR